MRDISVDGPGGPEREQQLASPLGKIDAEDEAEHLRRVANELGGANSTSLEALRTQLNSDELQIRRAAAAALGILGDRNAITALRGLLEGDDPDSWELAVHGLRHSRDRAGWLCLESVALDLLPTLSEARGRPHAFRLLVMGRTKTMDRLFRAVDGHSRAISAEEAINFSAVAVNSISTELSTVMALRLGIVDGVAVGSSTPRDVSNVTGYSLEKVRRLEAEAWETVQQPRRYQEIRRNYEVNNDRLRASD